MIIHIAGPSGAGKTTLGNKLKKKYGKKITVKDLDDIRDDFKAYHIKKGTSFELFRKNFKKNYQLFLDNYINEHNKKILIITGINTYINDERFAYKGHDAFKIKYKLNTRADHKFCIDLPADEILKQRWYREYDMFVKYTCVDLKESKDRLYEMSVKNEGKPFSENRIIPDFEWLFDRILHKRQIENWNVFYKKEGYAFLDRESIYKKVVRIIDKSL